MATRSGSSPTPASRRNHAQREADGEAFPGLAVRAAAVQRSLWSPVSGVPSAIRSWRSMFIHPAQNDGQMTVRRSRRLPWKARDRGLTWENLWSYGDSNPGPLACHQQAARPPQYVCAGHRPRKCAPVPSSPHRLRYFPAVPASLAGQAPNKRLTSQNHQEIYRCALHGDQHPPAPDECRKAPAAVPRLRPRPLPLPHSRQPEIRITSHRRALWSPESGRPRLNARIWLICR